MMDIKGKNFFEQSHFHKNQKTNSLNHEGLYVIIHQVLIEEGN